MRAMGRVRSTLGTIQNKIVPPMLPMLEMTTGFWASQALYVAAKLEIADALKTGPKAIDRLADQTNTHKVALARLLRTLSGLGVFREREDGRFELTDKGELLRRDHPHSIRSFVILQCEIHWRFWGNLLYSVRTGRPAAEDLDESSYFEFLKKNPERAKIFDEAMTSISQMECQAVLACYDFSHFRKIADIGGGHGRLLGEILNACHQTSGILFDLDHVIQGAMDAPFLQDLSRRVEFKQGSFFDPVPEGADAYILKHILHDWPDEKALEILRNLNFAMKKGATLLIIEAVLPQGNTPHFSKLLDLEMLITVGGRERNRDDWAILLADAGFRLTNIFPTPAPLSIIESVRI